jgi:hypothetical protein
MRALQFRHDPPSRRKLSTGMLSHALIGALQEGHRDDGQTIEMPLGIR